MMCSTPDDEDVDMDDIKTTNVMNCWRYESRLIDKWKSTKRFSIQLLFDY